jgi:hypothetical protein
VFQGLLIKKLFMKVIVVSGARSNIGKTHLSKALCGLLPVAVHIKIGHHPRKQGGDNFYYNKEINFSALADEHKNARFLVIESNRILEEITPDCVIYLPADNPKLSAGIAEKKADIIRGKLLSESKMISLAGKLDCDKEVIRKIAEFSGALIESI